MNLPHETTAERLYFFDWIRILAFVLLVLYHVGMYYVSWGWHIKSPDASSAIEPLMFLTNPWRMGLLFLISGVATRFMLARQKPVQFARSRSGRILLPLIFGMAVIVPPQPFLEVVHKLNYAGSYADFLSLYFQVYKGFVIEGKRLDLPTWNHLWFLAYIWVYSLLFAALARLVPQLFVLLDKLLEARLRGIWIIVLPVAYLAIARITLLSGHPSTHNLTDDWFNHATYLFLFLFGFIAARQTRFWSEVAQVRWRSLVIALVCWVFLASYFTYYRESREVPIAMVYFQRAVWTLMAWNAMLALCGFARQHWNKDHPSRSYLNQAVFPVYILHQSLIIILAWQLRPFHVPPVTEGLILIVATLGISFLAYEAIRRVALLRPLFGLKF
jgi:glucans biosynthesis protein C